jgi:hypothetical protein
MKTAMQELIEKVEHAISYNVEGGLVEKYTWTELFNDMELSLEKEKEQTVGFGNKMQIVQDVSYDGNITFCFNPEEYYNQTYNQNK